MQPPRIFFCPDCHKKISIDEKKAHARECVRTMYSHWRSTNFEKAEKWEAICANIFYNKVLNKSKSNSEKNKSYKKNINIH